MSQFGQVAAQVMRTSRCILHLTMKRPVGFYDMQLILTDGYKRPGTLNEREPISDP